MNDTQLPFLVEGILMIIAGILGILLKKAGKPYGKIKLVLHLFFFLWLSVGYWFIASVFLAIDSSTKAILIPVAIIGFMILIQLITGILKLFTKEKRLPKLHLITSIIMLLADIYAFIISGLN